MSNDYDWRYENSILKGKERLILSEQDEKYLPWRTNAVVSNYVDAIFDVNMVNMMYDIPLQMQYDYLFHSVRKQYRKFEKSAKNNKRYEEDLNLISDYYKYNIVRSKEVMKILTKDQIEIIRKKTGKRWS